MNTPAQSTGMTYRSPNMQGKSAPINSTTSGAARR